MAKVIDKGYKDTPINGVTKLDFPRGLLNFKEDFREKQQVGKKEVLLTNITSPIDREEKIRIAIDDVKNVYANTSIDPSVYAPTRRGVSVLAQISDVLSVRDDQSPEYRVDLPVSAHLVIKVPSSEHIDGEQVRILVGRLLSSLFDTGATSTARLEAILRGSLLPSDL